MVTYREMLQGMETLVQGRTSDLKVDTGRYRVWVSRISKDDGAPFDHTGEVEGLFAGRWETLTNVADLDVPVAGPRLYWSVIDDDSLTRARDGYRDRGRGDEVLLAVADDVDDEMLRRALFDLRATAV